MSKTTKNLTHQQAVAQMDMLAKSLGLVSYTDLASALCDVLDGDPDHDINPSETGMPQEDCDKVIKIRAEARKAWRDSQCRLVCP